MVPKINAAKSAEELKTGFIPIRMYFSVFKHVSGKLGRFDPAAHGAGGPDRTVPSLGILCARVQTRTWSKYSRDK